MPLNGNPVSILVIEDNPADFFLLKECLSQTPINIAHIECAPTLARATELLDREIYSLIFLDLSLPDAGFNDCFELIKKTAGDIPIIVLSGMSSQSLALDTINKGAQDYILKDKLESELITKTISYSIERTKSRRQLQESDRRFRYISEHFPSGTVSFLDRNLKYIFATGGEFKRQKTDTELLEGQKFTNFFPEKDRWRIERKLMGAFKQKEVLFETEANGQIFLVSAIGASEGTGMPENILVVSQNITELKRAEERLHFQSTVLENITDAVIITDLNKKVTFWNKAATGTYGYDELEMLGQSVEKLAISGEEDGSELVTLLHTLNEKGLVNIVTRRKTKDGRIIWVELKISYNYSVSRKIIGLIGVSKDITEQKAEEHLLKLFQSVIINSNDAVVITEAVPSEGDVRKIVFVNEAFCEITGFGKNEIISNTLLKLVGPLSDKNEVLRIQKNLTSWNSFTSEILFYKKNGSTFWVDIMIMPVSDESGNYTHWVFIQRDITADKESAEKLLLQNKELTKTNLELDRFVYSASHDLRAPLTSVLGLVGLMRKESFGEPSKIFLDKIQESVQRLDRLIQNIINYSRNSRLNLQSVPVNFREIFETAVGMHKFMDNSRMVKFEFENKCEENYFSDPDRWQIIVNNLVSNGIKFSRHDVLSFIRMKIHREKDELVVELSDNGIGITKDQLEYVFQMFYRATNTSEGSGLGLYIVKQTAELLGGAIEVESESMKFTKFIIRVPFEFTPINPITNAEKGNLTAQ
jgi:PAS domain S-box-containing protein